MGVETTLLKINRLKQDYGNGEYIFSETLSGSLKNTLEKIFEEEGISKYFIIPIQKPLSPSSLEIVYAISFIKEEEFKALTISEMTSLENILNKIDTER